MKFLIQTYNGKVKHDFSFTLLESIRFQNDWNNMGIKFKLTDDKTYPDYIPIGSNQFVILYLEKYYGLTPKPINIPKELLKKEFTNRNIIFGTEKDVTVRKKLYNLVHFLFLPNSTIELTFYLQRLKIPITDGYSISLFLHF
jgi:hypothetical protein